MADIRINALATTATTPASDDYLALDGTAQGTRKILATNIANNVTDVILGSSGPSVKSSLSARAPRQGLVMNGAQTTTTVANIPAFGTSAWTVSAWINVAANKNFNGIFGTASNGGLWVYTNASGGLSAGIRPNADGFANFVDVGKTILLTITNDGTTATVYKNGVYFGNSTSGNLIGNYTDAINVIGNSTGSSDPANAAILQPLIYNRALSASEVVALYEAGAPAGADYNSASNTAVNLATTVNASSFNYDTFSGASASGFTAVKTNTTTAASAYSGTDIPLVVGQRLRVSFTCTLTSGTLPVLYLSSTDGALASGASSQITAGANVIEMTCTVANSAARVRFFNGPANPVNYTISSLSITRIGLLLAPDAAQAGGGLVWYDTSGNAANITLPASGVSWNVPTSGYVTSGGVLNLLAGGSNKDVVITPSGTGIVNFGPASASSYSTFWENASSANGLQAVRNGVTFSTPLTLQNRGGNVLIGTTTDGGQKLQVSGSGIFGNTTGASTTTPVNLSLGGTYGTTYANGIKLSVFDGGGTKHGLGVTSGVLYFATTDTATTIQLATNNTTALTLDSSQSAKFANQVAANNGSLLVYYNSGSARISPSLIADVSSTATTTSGLAPALLIRNRGTATQNQWARIGFAAGSAALSATDGIIGAEISAQFVGTVASGNTRSTDIVFGTADQTVAQEPIERMRIKYNGRINFASLPTSSAGLAAGDIWNDGGTLKIV